MNRDARLRRKRRIRRKLVGRPERPRLSVFRSARHIYAQVIDDVSRKTLAAASTQRAELKDAAKDLDKTRSAEAVGKEIAKVCVERGITSVVFDRNGYIYHGRVKALAEAARVGGLEF